MIDLDEFSSAELLQARIASLGHSGGFTDVSLLFNYAANEYFQRPGNIRPNVLHVIVYIGDGLYTGEDPSDDVQVG